MTTRQHAPRANLDAVVFSVDQFRDWLYTAKRDELCLYHSGSIVIDQESMHHLKPLGDYASLMSDLGAVLLNQSRKGAGLYHYLARRTSMKAVSIPKLVGTGAVEVPFYICLKAIKTRDPHKSVKRAIRDILSCSEKESAAMFNKLVSQGYITEGRPPALTETGVSVLT